MGDIERLLLKAATKGLVENLSRNGIGMAEHEPSESAKRRMHHKPYAAAVMIREQRKQIEHLSPTEYIQKKGIGR